MMQQLVKRTLLSSLYPNLAAIASVGLVVPVSQLTANEDFLL